MGSHTFDTFVEAGGPWKIDTAQKAYDRACDDALHEYGHDGYNGTISTTYGFSMSTREILTRRQADKLMEKTIDNFSKWEACGCIPIGKAKAKTRKVTRTVKFVHAEGVYFNAKFLASQITLQPGEAIVDWKILDVAATAKTKVIRNRGAAERVFIVHGSNGQRTEFSDLASAVASVTAGREEWLARKNEHLAKYPSGSWDHFKDAVITEEVRRGGLAPAAVTTEVTYKAKVEVNLETIVAQPTEVSGWLFYGWAAS